MIFPLWPSPGVLRAEPRADNCNICLAVLAEHNVNEKRQPMQKQHLVLGFLVTLVVGAHAVEAPAQTCEQIREEIMAVKGLVAVTPTELLQKISLRSECQFTSAEVYRVAYGDMPLPPPEPYRQHDKAHKDHDD